MRSARFHLCVVAVLAFGVRARAAELSFAPLFNDGVVLQCELPVNIWGRADAGAAVMLRIDDRIAAQTVADAAGRWQAVLPPHAPGGAHVLAAQAGTSAAKVAGVWFGEVWLASGQSNMVQPLKNSHGGEARLALTLPEIRFAKVPQRTGLPVERELTTEELAWREFAPPHNQQIAAVAFYFAEQILRATGRRVGILQSSVGGTPAQAWTPLRALEVQPALRHYAETIRSGLAAGKSKETWLHEASALDRWKDAVTAWEMSNRDGSRPLNPGAPDPRNPWLKRAPTVLFENMIAPLVPFTTRGVIWYQGEANAGAPDEYRVLFPAMIAEWRKEWGRKDWPFLFVQLAAYDARAGDWPGLRAAQAFARDTVPHTGMATAIDCGEKEQIHPRAKQPVGERLARLALAQVYGRSVEARGPVAVRVEAAGNRLVVVFLHVVAGLSTADGGPAVPGFEVAAPDGDFHAAEARVLAADRVEVACPDIRNPVSVRYAWSNWMEPPVTLRNSANLPAEPFSLAVTLPAANSLAPNALRTEFLENPLGLDTVKPRFSWMLEDTASGARQTAYQVQAASSPEKLANGEADLWDSGKVASDQSHLVEYAGKPLGSCQQGWWRVKTWNQEGQESAWAKPAWFELALLADPDWKAQWVRADLPPENNDATQAWVRMTTVPVIDGNLTRKPDAPFNSAPKTEVPFTPNVMREAETACRQRLEKLDPCPMLRREIELRGAIRRARAYVAAPGFFELRINGRKVGDRELEPGVTPFPQQVLYAVHDITSYLREGTNALGLILGHGWFDSSHIGHCLPIGDDPVARAHFEFQFEDGRRLIVVTDESWKCAPGPILKDSHWLGECYDARRELAGWDQPGFHAGAWKDCLPAKSPTKRLAPDLVPPERVTRRVKAKRLYSPAHGVWVYDMGEAFSGAAELKVDVPAGTTLTLRYAQRVFAADQEAGSLLHYDHFSNLDRRHGMIASSEGSMGTGGKVAGRKYQAFAPTDVYVARGGGTEIWRRRFGYTAYRYIELTGYPGTPPEDAVTGVVVHTDLPRQGRFECSDDLLNRIYTACVNSLLYCTHGFTQDNPTREKQFTPWASAASSGLAAGFSSPSLSRIWTKLVDASLFTQDASGHFLPFFGFRENYECPVTESGSIPLAYELWLRYGDDRPLRRSLDGFAAYLDYYFNNPQNRRDKGLHPTCATAAADLSQSLLRGGMYTFDWYDDDTVVDMPPGQLPQRETRKLMWGSGTLCEDLARFIAMARHAGRDVLVTRYSALLDAIRAEIRQQLFNANSGSYGCQGSDALALTAGVAAPGERARVVTAIVNDIVKRGGRFTTGTHGFPRLLAVLSENGHADVAYQLVAREGYPGLANLLQTGNGTFGETWNTWRTPYGSVGGTVQSERGTMGFWFIEWLGGIRPDHEHPGGQHILLHPVFPAKLDSARTEVPSPYGPIRSEWKRDGGMIRWIVTVPWNMAAMVRFPDGATRHLESGRHQFAIPNQRKP